MRYVLSALTLAGLFLMSLLPIASAEEPMHTKDSLETAKQNIKDGKAVLVDVREQKEWDEGHITGAIFMPKSKLDVEKEAAELAKKLDKSKIIYTHCRGGRRALACGEILKKQGFDVRPLKPGYEDLLKAGFEKAK
jgi:rhodanese-related sulfurtransferase